MLCLKFEQTVSKLLLCFICSFTLSCAKARSIAETFGHCSGYAHNLPPNVPEPPPPPENCMNQAKADLGRRLFYDKDLSLNQKQSCATCHQLSRGFTDGLKQPKGSTGQIHPRNAMALADIAYLPYFTWFNPDVTRIENQTLIPFFAENTATTIEELAISGQEHTIAARLRADPRYPAMFSAAFYDRTIDIIHVAKALAAFESTFISYQTPYDLGTMSNAAKRGQLIFQSERAGCSHCHAGRDFNLDDRSGKPEFVNVGLYNVSSLGDYPDANIHGAVVSRATQGLFLITEKAGDRGKFRTPSLRNVALTGPYMHDGSVASLEEVIEIFDAGGRNVRSGPLTGDGRVNPNKDPRIRARGFSHDEKRDLVEFLRSLTDDCFLTNPKLIDPTQPPPVMPGYCR